MARRRFNATEKALLTPGALVEWHNGGGHWHPGIILGAPAVDSVGSHYAPMRNLATTKTISPGDHYRATPEKVRPRS